MSAYREKAFFVAQVPKVTARLRASEGLAAFVGLVPVELLNRWLMEWKWGSCFAKELTRRP